MNMICLQMLCCCELLIVHTYVQLPEGILFFLHSSFPLGIPGGAIYRGDRLFLMAGS